MRRFSKNLNSQRLDTFASEDFEILDIDRFERTMTQNTNSFASATNPYAETANTNAEDVIRKNII
jgi:hypothetical protein